MKRSLVRGALVVFGFVVVVSFACYLAYAYSTGISGQTKKNSATAGCGAKVSGGGGCHGVNADTAVQVLLSGPSALPVGTPGTFSISVSGGTTTGGGCDIAVSSGTLSSGSTLLQVLNQELTHVSPIATPFSVEFSYTSNSPGTVTMYANGKTSDGWNWAPNFTLRIGPPPAPSPLLPADGSSAVPTSITLMWSGVQGPKWNVEVSASQSFGSLLAHEDSLADTTFTIPEGILANNTQYFWRVRGSDFGGTSAWSQIWSFSTALTGVEDALSSRPTEFALAQNYPNPFNPGTRIQYTVGGTEGRGASVKLVVFDLLGNEVAVLVNDRQPAGRYVVSFDASGLPSGIYLYRLTAGGIVHSRKMLLVR